MRDPALQGANANGEINKVEVCSLVSGSGGNALFCKADGVSVLIDAGLSCRALEKAMALLKEEVASLQGILITHEHSDHCKGLPVVSKKYHLPIYGTYATLQKLSENLQISPELFREITPNEDFYIKRLNITPFSLPHDAIDPVGYSLTCDGVRVSDATDLGLMKPEILTILLQSDLVLLEANYDEEMLLKGPYPPGLKKRIAGNKGHLSNAECAKTASVLLKGRPSCLLLGHLSKENNVPELALSTVKQALVEENLSHCLDKVHLTYHDRATDLYKME